MASCCTSDCPVQYGYCPQNKNSAQITNFQNQLDELKNVFYLVLERYRDAYPLKMAAPTNESVDLYNESKSQLESTFNDLFLLENSIEASLDQLNTGVKMQDNILSSLKDRYNKDTSELEVLRNTNLASYPMKREFEQFRFNGYLDLGYYIIGSIIVCFLLFKGVKGKKTPAAQPQVTLGVPRKVAKISTLSAAIIAAILSVYYG